jgi:hypothetical protein
MHTIKEACGDGLMMLLNRCRVVEIETNMKMGSGPALVSEGEWWQGTTHGTLTG